MLTSNEIANIWFLSVEANSEPKLGCSAATRLMLPDQVPELAHMSIVSIRMLVVVPLALAELTASRF